MSTTSISAAAAQSAPAANHPSFSETLAGVQQSQPEEQAETANGIPSRPLSQPGQLSQLGLAVGSPATDGQATGDGSSSSQPETRSGSPQPQLTAAKAEAGTEAKEQSTEDVYVTLNSSSEPIGQPANPALKDTPSALHEPGALHETAPVHQAAILRTTSNSLEKSRHTKEAATSSKFARSALEAAADASALPAATANNNPALANPGSAVASSSAGVSALAEPDSNSRPKSSTPKADLAFAVKIQGSSRPDSKNQATTESLPAESGEQPSAAPSSAAPSSAAPSSLDMKSTPGGSEQKDGNPDLADKVPAKTASPENFGTPAAALPASQAHPAAAASVKPAESAAKQAITGSADSSDDGRSGVPSLKTVQVQLTADNNQRVDLRLMEKSGTLSISVRTADGALTKALQQQLPELSSKLSDQQVRAEWWTPSLQKTEAAQSTKDSSSGSGGQPANQDQGNQSKGNSGQQSGRGTREPDWVEELADLRKSNQNGAQYTWHL